MNISLSVGAYSLGDTNKLETYVGAAERLGVDSVRSAQGWAKMQRRSRKRFWNRSASRCKP
jgi:hypothetical protein